MMLSTSQPLPAGRPKKPKNRGLPPRLKPRPSGGVILYYFVHADGWQEPLGSDLNAALEGWKVRYSPGSQTSPSGFTTLSEAWEKSPEFATLAIKTQGEYGNAMTKLRLVFHNSGTENIEHAHILKMKREMRSTPVQFKRYKSCLSSFWNWAVDEEYLDAPNPCIGVKGYKSKARSKVKVTDAMFYAVYDEGEQVLKDWMDMAVVCGPRVMDCTRLKKTNIEHGKLHVTHGKKNTGTILPVEADLKEVIDELLSRDRKVSSVYLIADEAGQPLTYWTLRDLFDDAMAKAVAKNPELAIWQRRDLRGKNASDADSLQEAQERLGHDDSRTTATFYRQAMKAKPGRRPRR